MYYTGPYCSPRDEKSIFLGVFTDLYCSAITDPNVFSTITGFELPFSSKSLVSSKCHSCAKASNNNANNNNNGNNQHEPSESCTDLYENAAKCETKMDISSKDKSSCEFINNILPRLTAASRSTGSSRPETGKHN
jgi:hypothetical protein